MISRKYKIAFVVWSITVAGAYAVVDAQQYNGVPYYNAGIVYNQSDITNTATFQQQLSVTNLP